MKSVLTTFHRPTRCAPLGAESLHMPRSNKSRICGCCISHGTRCCLVSWCAVVLRNDGCKSTGFGDEIQRGDFHNSRRISWLADWMLTSQEQVCCEVSVWCLQCQRICRLKVMSINFKNVFKIAQNTCGNHSLMCWLLTTEVHFSLTILAVKINWNSVNRLPILRCRVPVPTIPFRNVKCTEQLW
jgi:hypothetical protein